MALNWRHILKIRIPLLLARKNVKNWVQQIDTSRKVSEVYNHCTTTGDWLSRFRLVVTSIVIVVETGGERFTHGVKVKVVTFWIWKWKWSLKPPEVIIVKQEQNVREIVKMKNKSFVKSWKYKEKSSWNRENEKQNRSWNRENEKKNRSWNHKNEKKNPSWNRENEKNGGGSDINC